MKVAGLERRRAPRRLYTMHMEAGLKERLHKLSVEYQTSMRQLVETILRTALDDDAFVIRLEAEDGDGRRGVKFIRTCPEE